MSISVIYCRIDIRLILVKGEWRLFYFVKITFYVTFGLTDMTSLSFQLRISLLFFNGLSHDLVREILDIHVTLRSYEISCDPECHLDLLGQLLGKWIFFLRRSICPFITPSILDRITSNFQRWSLNFRLHMYYVIKSLKWHISVIHCRIELISALAKSDWWSASLF